MPGSVLGLGVIWNNGKENGNYCLGLRLWDLGFPWTSKVCKILALMAVTMGLGLLFYILLGFR